MSRGIISVYWGDESKLQWPIDRLKASVKKFHPELTHQFIKVDASMMNASSLNQKALMFDLSPFDETLFLDIDTVVMGNLDFGFEKAKIHGLALSICECPWAKRYTKLFTGDEIEYNTGVIFFTRKAHAVFETWKDLAPAVDSSLIYAQNGKVMKSTAADQGSFALAIEQTNFNPFVLPLNWNLRPSWHNSYFGPIKIWHDYSNPPAWVEELNHYYTTKESIIQYHS